jgi:DNA-binding transcriptional LysR family regulator
VRSPKDRTEIAASEDLNGFLEATLALFREVHPTVSAELRYLDAEEVYKAVKKGDIGFALVGNPRAIPGIVIEPWHGIEVALIVPHGHHLAKLTRLYYDPADQGPRKWQLSASDLAGVDFVAFSEGQIVRREVDSFLAAQNVRVNITQTSSDVNSVKDAVRHGAGVSIVPIDTVKDNEIILLDGLAFLPIGIILRKGATSFEGRDRTLIEFLRDVSPPSPIGLPLRDAMDVRARKLGVDDRNWRLNTGRFSGLVQCEKCLRIYDLLREAIKQPNVCNDCGGSLKARYHESVDKPQSNVVRSPLKGSDGPRTNQPSDPSHIACVGQKMVEDKSIITRKGRRFIPLSLAAPLVQTPKSTLTAWLKKKIQGQAIQTYTSPRTGAVYISEESVQLISNRFIKWPSEDPSGPVTLGETDDETGYLTLPESMRVLGVSKRTIWLWAKEGKASEGTPLDVIQCTVSHYRYIREKDVLALKSVLRRDAGNRIRRVRAKLQPQP